MQNGRVPTEMSFENNATHEHQLFRFEYLNDDQLEALVENDPDYDLECPVCMIAVEQGSGIPAVKSDILEI